jgi:hypothetical protein
MKYLSLAMVAVIIGLSWYLIKTPNDLTAEQHARLQEVIKQYLSVYLKETNPIASDIQDAQVITRVVEPGKKMQAQFKFFYNVPGDHGTTNKIAREGLFILTSENGNDWTAKMERINDSFVEFSEALQITLGAPSAAEEPAKEDTQKTPEKAAQ